MPAPRTLGKYLITGVIGEGAMGVVYRAVDPVIGRTVALKTLPRARALAPGLDPAATAAFARFRHEAQAVGRLAHPGIVAVHEYAEQDGLAWIVMEHVEGHNLSQWLARAPRLPLDAVVSVMDQLLGALEAAHAAGVWHLDIKPSNLLVTSAGRVKLTDFGIARIAGEDDTEDTSITGSPGYIAPEQYTGAGLDHRADLFAAGVLMHRLLVGRAPFAGTPEQAMYKTLNEHPLPVSEAARAPDAPGRDDVRRDDRFDAVVARALQKHPDDRFASAAAFRRELRQAAGLDPAAAPAPASFADIDPEGVPVAYVVDAVTTTIARPVTVAPPTSPSLMRAPVFQVGDGTPEERAWRDGVQAALQGALGPVAPALLRRARRLTRDPASLVARLAASIGDEAARTRFLRAVRELSKQPLALRRAAPGFGVSAPAAPSARDGLPAAAIGHALRVLTTHLGSQARSVIKGVAGRARSTEELHALILAQAEGDIDRRLLRKQLARGPH